MYVSRLIPNYWKLLVADPQLQKVAVVYYQV